MSDYREQRDYLEHHEADCTVSQAIQDAAAHTPVVSLARRRGRGLQSTHPMVAKFRRMSQDPYATPSYRDALRWCATELEKWDAEQ